MRLAAAPPSSSDEAWLRPLRQALREAGVAVRRRGVCLDNRLAKLGLESQRSLPTGLKKRGPLARLSLDSTLLIWRRDDPSVPQRQMRGWKRRTLAQIFPRVREREIPKSDFAGIA